MEKGSKVGKRRKKDGSNLSIVQVYSRKMYIVALVGIRELAFLAKKYRPKGSRKEMPSKR